MSPSVTAADRFSVALDVQPRLLAESIARVLLTRGDIEVVDLEGAAVRPVESTRVRYDILVTATQPSAEIDADLVVQVNPPPSAGSAASWPGNVVCITRLGELLACIDEWRSARGAGAPA